jgi:hypothetical protein
MPKALMVWNEDWTAAGIFLLGNLIAVNPGRV